MYSGFGKVYRKKGATNLVTQYSFVQGAHLASVHSIEENNFIMLEVNAAYEPVAWLGLSSLQVDEGYAWADTSPAEFFNWMYNEPNNFNDMESCITTNGADGWVWVLLIEEELKQKTRQRSSRLFMGAIFVQFLAMLAVLSR